MCHLESIISIEITTQIKDLNIFQGIGTTNVGRLQVTLGLLLRWQTNKSSSFCSLPAAVPADVIQFSFSSYLHDR